MNRPAELSHNAALHPLSLADTLSRSVIATIDGPNSFDSRCATLLIALEVQMARRDIGVRHFEAEHRLDVFLVGDDEIDMRMSGRITFCACASVQSFLRKFRSTDTFTPAFLRGFDRLARARGGLLAQRRRDAGHVKPVRALKDPRPVDSARLELADGRTRRDRK